MKKREKMSQLMRVYGKAIQGIKENEQCEKSKNLALLTWNNCILGSATAEVIWRWQDANQ